MDVKMYRVKCYLNGKLVADTVEDYNADVSDDAVQQAALQFCHETLEVEVERVE